MTPQKIPLRLKKDPIVEAIFEFRFSGHKGMPLSDLLPGMLYSRLSGEYSKIIPIATSQIPRELRSHDPNLIYKPTHKLVGGQFSVSIGDRVATISCAEPYVGWESFKKVIRKVVNVIGETKLVENIERYSIKYINLLPVLGDAPSLDSLRVNVSLGDYNLKKHSCQLTTQIYEEGFINIIQVMSDATVLIGEKQEKRVGTLLDIDTIYKDKISDFWDALPDALDELRMMEKKMFFSFISEESLKEFEPVWEEEV